MPSTINNDDFDYEKRGRAVSHEQHRAMLAARARQLISLGGTSGNRSAVSHSPSTESVLKVIGWSKTQHSAGNQARYIGRERDADAEARDTTPKHAYQSIDLENERGEILHGRDQIDAEMRSWELTPATENRSRAWKEASPADRAAMSANDALSRRQSAHLIFSLPAHPSNDPETLRAAARDGLQQTLGAAGYRYVWAIHTDHGRGPHVHIIAKARSEPQAGDPRTSKQLRLGPLELDTMRQVLTDEARARGLTVTATRRIDRARTREKIERHQEQLHQSKTRGALSRDNQTRQASLFEKKAPQWYATHGLDYERRRLASLQRDQFEFARKEPEPTKSPGLLGRLRKAFTRTPESPAATAQIDSRPQSKALDRLDRFFETTHKDSVKARESFLQMYAEAPKLAVWAANNHPQTFGNPTGSKPDQALTGRGLRAVLNDKSPSPAPPKSLPPDQRREAIELRQTTHAARQRQQAERDNQHVQRNLTRLAVRLDAGDGGARAQAHAQAIRHLAQAQNIRDVAEKEWRLTEMDRQARQRAQARAQQQARERGQDIDR